MVKMARVALIVMALSCSLTVAVGAWVYIIKTCLAHEEAIIDHEERIQELEDLLLEWEVSKHSL